MQVVLILEEIDQEINFNSSIPLGVYPVLEDVIEVLKEEGFIQSPVNPLIWGLPADFMVKEKCVTFLKVVLVESENYDFRTLVQKYHRCIPTKKNVIG